MFQISSKHFTNLSPKENEQKIIGRTGLGFLAHMLERCDALHGRRSAHFSAHGEYVMRRPSPRGPAAADHSQSKVLVIALRCGQQCPQSLGFRSKLIFLPLQLSDLWKGHEKAKSRVQLVRSRKWQFCKNSKNSQKSFFGLLIICNSVLYVPAFRARIDALVSCGGCGGRSLCWRAFAAPCERPPYPSPPRSVCRPRREMSSGAIGSRPREARPPPTTDLISIRNYIHIAVF